jgi:hypothetical protein
MASGGLTRDCLCSGMEVSLRTGLAQPPSTRARQAVIPMEPGVWEQGTKGHTRPLLGGLLAYMTCEGHWTHPGLCRAVSSSEERLVRRPVQPATLVIYTLGRMKGRSGFPRSYADAVLSRFALKPVARRPVRLSPPPATPSSRHGAPSWRHRGGGSCLWPRGPRWIHGQRAVGDPAPRPPAPHCPPCAWASGSKSQYFVTVTASRGHVWILGAWPGRRINQKG